MEVGARQSFQFFRQIIWFLGNNRALSKFRYWILYNLISIIKLSKIHSVKANFKPNTQATLTAAPDRIKPHNNGSLFDCNLSEISKVR